MNEYDSTNTYKQPEPQEEEKQKSFFVNDRMTAIKTEDNIVPVETVVENYTVGIYGVICVLSGSFTSVIKWTTKQNTKKKLWQVEKQEEGV